MVSLDGDDLRFYGRGYVMAPRGLFTDDSQNEYHQQGVCQEVSHFFFLILMRISLNVVSCYARWNFNVI